LHLDTYERDGIVFPAGRIDVSGFAEGYARFQADSIRLRGRETYIKPHLASVWLDGVVRCPAIVDVVEQIIGPDIVLWESDWSVKRAGTDDYVPWHQDSPYWNLSTDDVVSVWVAIGDVTVENGAMEVVLGSHRHGQVGALSVSGDVHESYARGVRTTDIDCMFPYTHELDDAVDVSRATAVELRSGEFSIHSIHLVHGGGPNPSAQDRIGFAMRYISADTRCRSGIDSVTAIRGDCQRDYYDLEPPADGEFTPAGLAALERALEYPSGFGEAKRIR
jgi:chlorinating enzyme